MKQLTHGSLFAGIGGFDDGFRRSGMRVVWQVEREPFCKAILRTRFPEAELLNDVTECGKHNLGAVDVLTAGFPCQDLSVAGKRAGLAGARSGLFWEVVRIVGELRPAWFVLENVPGLFSSNNGEDFRIVLESLDGLGYGLAWRVLDSQFFGVAQRRRRVFIVGSFGKPCPAEVLFEPEGGEGDFAEGGETGTGVAAETGTSFSESGQGWWRDGVGTLRAEGENRPSRPSNLAIFEPYHDEHEGRGASFRATDKHQSLRGPNGTDNALVATALSSSAGHHDHSSPRGDGSDNIIVQQAISSKWSKGSSGPAGDEHHNLIAIQDVRGHRNKKQNGIGIDASGGAMYTLDGTSQHAVASLSGLGSGGPDDNDGQAGRIVSATSDTNGVRDFAGLPEGLDSARYRALGNAVTAKVSRWIGRRIVAASNL